MYSYAIEKLNYEMSFNKALPFIECLENLGYKDLSDNDFKIIIKNYFEQNNFQKLNRKQAFESDVLKSDNLIIEPKEVKQAKSKNLTPLKERVVYLSRKVASKNELRPALTKVFHDENCLVATDGAILVSIEVEEKGSEEQYDRVGKDNKEGSVYPRYKNIVPVNNTHYKDYVLKTLLEKAKGIVKVELSNKIGVTRGVIEIGEVKTYFTPAKFLKVLTALYDNGTTSVSLSANDNRAILINDIDRLSQYGLVMPINSVGGFGLIAKI